MEKYNTFPHKSFHSDEEIHPFFHFVMRLLSKAACFRNMKLLKIEGAYFYKVIK